jgi:hypothetical protein
VTEDAATSLIRLPEGGFHPIDFQCPDASKTSPPLEADVPDANIAPLCTAIRPNVHYSVDVAPIFGSCSGELCHDAWKYATTVGVLSVECCDQRKLVDPGRPTQSYLLQKLEGVDLCGYSSAMPPGTNAPQSVIDVVQSWICLGALDD